MKRQSIFFLILLIAAITWQCKSQKETVEIPPIDTNQLTELADTPNIIIQPPPPRTEITFKVQIIAVKERLTDEEIAEIYNDNLPVSVTYSDEMFKYMVGNFKVYEEAKEYESAIGIEDAFVVGFKNGQEMDDIMEAIRLSRE